MLLSTLRLLDLTIPPPPNGLDYAVHPVTPRTLSAWCAFPKVRQAVPAVNAQVIPSLHAKTRRTVKLRRSGTRQSFGISSEVRKG